MRTRETPDSSVMGYQIYVHNAESLALQLQELATLYPPAHKILVPLPEEPEPGRLWYSRIVDEDV